MSSELETATVNEVTSSVAEVLAYVAVEKSNTASSYSLPTPDQVGRLNVYFIFPSESVVLGR